MYRYITSSKSSTDEVISDMQVLHLKWVSSSLGRYEFLDDSNNRYIYDRGTFNDSKFVCDLNKVRDSGNLQNAVLVVRAKTKMHIVNGVAVGVYHLVSPKLLEVKE